MIPRWLLGLTVGAAVAGLVGCSTQPTSPTPSTAGAPRVTLVPYAQVPGEPVAIVAPPDGSGRLFVASQSGQVWAVRDGTVGPGPMLDIASRITSGGERGLLGIAVHPRFPADPRVFLDYTDVNGNTVVSSFTIDVNDPSRLDPASELVILTTIQPYPNHNGGALAFGPDGDLYISLGDGGSEGDPQGNGQRLDTTLGKILRIDVNGAAGGRPYAIPPDNPFASVPAARPEIWLYGLRNPWRLSFDPATGDLWIGDVGQDTWEEVDVIRGGAGGLNLGWNRMEGRHCFQPAIRCDTNGLTLPIVEYGHDQGCAIIGGYVYRGTAFPVLRGGYLFADYCSGNIWEVDAAANPPATPVIVGKTGSGTSAFGVGADGELYVANLDGTISKVSATSR
jgi:glucose/arabinose dehydrogenase